MKTQQATAPFLDPAEVGHDLLQLVVDVFGVQLISGCSARIGSLPGAGRTEPAWRTASRAGLAARRSFARWLNRLEPVTASARKDHRCWTASRPSRNSLTARFDLST